MNRIFALFLFVMMGAAPCAGQGPDGSGAGDERARVSKAMYEDIEIFRRILDGKLTVPSPHTTLQEHFSLGVQPQAGSEGVFGLQLKPRIASLPQRNWFELSNHAGMHTTLGTEGVYLKGYGAVYNLTLPWHFQKLVADAAKPESKARSQWDMIRGELRGEKTEQPKTSSDRGEPAIADIILKLLAENGKNFTQIPDNEHITVALTVRPIGACLSCHDATTANPARFRKAELTWNPLSSGPTAGPSPSPLPQGEGRVRVVGDASSVGTLPGNVGASETADVDSQRTEVNNYVRLGEMRHKQGRLQDAIEAYRKAADLYQKMLDQPTPDDKDVSSAADVAAKLAQIYMLTGDQGQAFKTLQSIVRQPAGPGKGKANDAVMQREGSLPAKLIISAPKRLLDQVGRGEISYDDFKKKAVVQLIQFPAPGKAADKPTP